MTTTWDGTNHGEDSLGSYDEPAGGWVTSPQLIDTELLTTTLCRFTGEPTSHAEDCAVRVAGGHPNVECRALYHQSDALTSGVLNLDAFEVMPEEVRQPWTGGDQIGANHG